MHISLIAANAYDDHDELSMIYLHYLQIPQFLYFTDHGHIYQIYNICRGSAILHHECHHAALTANGLQ